MYGLQLLRNTGVFIKGKKREVNNLKKEDIRLKDILSNNGIILNKYNKACCPIHGEKTPSFSVRGEKWRCFGCGKGGDVIDLIMELKGYDYVRACKELGIEVNAGAEKVYNQKELIKRAFTKNDIKAIYTFTDELGNIKYYKVKLLDEEGKKIIRYAHLEGDRVVFNRGDSLELPYNLKAVRKAINEDKRIFIVEGEKDADTLNNMGYIATSLKGVTKYDLSFFKGARVYFIGDTGQAGEQYKKHIFSQLKDYVKEFNVIDPLGLNQLGDNKDITDWFESSQENTRERLEMDIKNSWDWKKSRSWKFVQAKETNDGIKYIPIAHTDNLELLLNRNDIKLKYNLISKEVEGFGRINSSRNVLITDICDLVALSPLKMNKDKVADSVNKIAYKHKYNSFADMLENNKGVPIKEVEKMLYYVFSLLELKEEDKIHNELYFKMFRTWCLNVVKMALNDLEKGFKCDGVLTLQGEQGCFKSTFFSKLMGNNSEWFLGGSSLKPKEKDSVIKNTNKILVELGELDATLKGEQGDLKAFITNSYDEYRSPYERMAEKHARITTYCATVNKKDFLKDETGSRRFWIIPVERCNIEGFKKIDIKKFWSGVYSLWLTGTYKDYLTTEEIREIQKLNQNYSFENDTLITIKENINWDMEKEEWQVYNTTEISNKLCISSKKAIKIALAHMGIEYKAYKVNGKTKKGYKLPKINMIL